ncbi:MAG: 3-hydroxyisobutyrate dehydrogenase-like beta-hydroxyacid dehydrogenase [Paracoccaceae bacterium]|jgi:3-hydroxyisobutyrate dehydrogenase-like beta-hydroxyacid dehydrogenase
MTKPTIAVLGTGLMGAPMAQNLLRAGFRLRVWNRSPAKAEALAKDGAIVCASPQEAARGAHYVLSMLSDGSATAVIVADKDITDALGEGTIWLEMSSVKPKEARAQRDHLETFGVRHLDAPVSGGTKGAEAGSLAIMVGGDVAVFEAAKSVFEPMGRAVHVGPSGSGQLAKLANQGIVAVTIGAVAEAMLLLEEGGADPAAVRDALKGGFADSIILQQHGPRMTTRNFSPGGISRLQLKDLDNLLEESTTLGLSLPVSQHIRDRFARFCEDLDGAGKDHSGLYLELRDHNDMKDD